ncbi:MAG: oxalurate catabolism protein HpxZ [Telmatospirillum sp.]|nr:oxalurate catabolism protein HpxZ [Telmatospirillum sp.]
MLELNIPEIVAEVQGAIERYERALVANDLDILDKSFWSSPLVVRFGYVSAQYGADALADYRRSRILGNFKRRLWNQTVTTFGRDFAVATVEYQRPDQTRQGRQSQTWVRTPDGWRVVLAHVSRRDEAE